MSPVPCLPPVSLGLGLEAMASSLKLGPQVTDNRHNDTTSSKSVSLIYPRPQTWGSSRNFNPVPAPLLHCCGCQSMFTYMGVSQNFGCPIIRVIVYSGLYWGLPFEGNPDFAARDLSLINI